MMVRIAAGALLFAATFCSSVFAEDTSPAQELQDHIDQINSQIDSETHALGTVDARSQEVEAQLKALRAERDKLKVEEQDLTKQLDAKSAERVKTSQDAQKLAAQAVELHNLSMRRMRAAYTHPAEQELGDLFRVARSDAFSHLGFYLASLRSYDRRSMDRLQSVQQELKEKEEDLKRETAEQEKLGQDLHARRDSIAKKVAGEEPLARALKDQRKDREGVLTQLRAQLLRFETVLAGLTGGGDLTDRRGHASENDVQRIAVVTPFEGKGLGVQRGHLTLPAAGKIVVPFGRQVTTNSGVAGLSKGIEIATSAGTPVRALAAGKVIFSGRMPLLGTIVILDHGARYYSLYGRLATVGAANGAVVDQGATIGTTAAPESDGRGLYFEIRKNGAPVNPAFFLDGNT